MFQKCPLCNGTGIDPNGAATVSIPICSICDGRKIINEQTGFPPQWKTQEEYDKEVGDFWVKLMSGPEATKIIDESNPKTKSKFQQRLEDMAKERGYELPKK